MRAQFTRPPRVRPAANRTSNDRDGPGTTPRRRAAAPVGY